MDFMLNEDYISYAIIAVGIFTVYMAVIHLFRTDRMQNRVRNAADPNYMLDNAEDAPPLVAKLCEVLLKTIKIDPANQKDVAIYLSRAGMTSDHAVTYFLFFKWFIQPVLVLAGLIILMRSFGQSGTDLLLGLLLGGILVLGGFKGGKLYVANKMQKRQQRLLESFPETLDLLLVCIEAGLGLDAALNRVTRELHDMHPEVVAELDRTRLELSMLNDRTMALQNLADRVNVVAFKTLVSALIQTEKFGTSLVDTLRVLSEEQRLTRLYTAEQKAARIPVLITIPLIICIMPAFIMIIVGPPVVKVISNGGLGLSLPKK